VRRDKIITIQDKNVLFDSDVAWLYGVETMRKSGGMSAETFVRICKFVATQAFMIPPSL
jgi:hypothetical protein